jgi:hypothetical protein
MSNQANSQDPMDFLKNMWGSMGFNLPGMVTPTLDVDELEKQITNMKAVEGWLKMNLQTLQMTIQGLEMQRMTLQTMQAFAQSSAANQQEAGASNPFANAAAMWPWNLMAGAAATTAPAPDAPATEPEPAAEAPAAKSKKPSTKD